MAWRGFLMEKALFKRYLANPGRGLEQSFALRQQSPGLRWLEKPASQTADQSMS
jgi:hypothetical protein